MSLELIELNVGWNGSAVKKKVHVKLEMVIRHSKSNVKQAVGFIRMGLEWAV